MSDSVPPPEETAIARPKAVRNWRGYMKEYVVIVVGVLTALAAQQAADWWRWKSEVAQAREVIATELADSVRASIMRIRAAPCVESRLDTVSDILDAAARTGRLPPVGIIGQAPAMLWPTGAWESVVASQTATHFPREQLTGLARVYKSVARAESFNVMEREAWSSLYAMVGPGRSLDPASEAELRRALSQARLANRMLMTSASSLMEGAKGQDLPYSREDLESIAAAKRTPLTGDKTRMWAGNVTVRDRVVVGLSLICDPIGPVPPRYGQSQNTYYQSRYDDYVRAVPDFGDGAKIGAP
jgi:hypothetical protein